VSFLKVEINNRKVTQEITAILRAINRTISESTDIYKDSLLNHRRKCHVLGNHQQYY
jgi:hypothetical protein